MIKLSGEEKQRLTDFQILFKLGVTKNNFQIWVQTFIRFMRVIILIYYIYSGRNVKVMLKSEKHLEVSNIIRTFATEIQSNGAEDNT